jgi:benzoate/toluate 1,2-dioxygenase beta subunit
MDSAMKENVRYVDDALYEALLVEAARRRERTGPSSFPRRELAESMLYHEARLLDERRYEQWLELYTDDCLYGVPAAAEPGDARLEAAINFDDRRRLLDRIALIRSGYLHAQIPPSRTCRMLGNIETFEIGEGAIEVRSNLILWAHRRDETTIFVGSQTHTLVRVREAWRIRRKLIELLDRDRPLGNITFIL